MTYFTHQRIQVEHYDFGRAIMISMALLYIVCTLIYRGDSFSSPLLFSEKIKYCRYIVYIKQCIQVNSLLFRESIEEGSYLRGDFFPKQKAYLHPNTFSSCTIMYIGISVFLSHQSGSHTYYKIGQASDPLKTDAKNLLSSR